MKLIMLLALSSCLYFNAQAAGTPGLNYNYYEGAWNTLPDFSKLTPVKKGVAANVTLDARSKDLQYAFLWQGYITITTDGTYTFETYSDDGSRLYIGTYGYTNTPLVNNDGEHAGQFVTGTVTLKAGVYPIAASFFQSYGGQNMEIWWSSNTGIARQKVPAGVLTVNDPGTPTASGLNYNYYEGTWSSLPDFNALTPVKQGVSANVMLDPRKKDLQYAFLWQGNITIPADGNYTFETYSDDGSKLYIGTYGYSTKPLVNNDGQHAGQFVTGTIALKAGVYPIAVSYFQSYGGQNMEIWWSSTTGIARQKVPDNAFQATTTGSTTGLNYNYYEGAFSSLPDFNTLTPVKQGTSANITLDPRKKDAQYAFLWQGNITIPADGNYIFETYSDDGSRLYIGTYGYKTTPLVNNDGEHAGQFVTGTIALKAGVYPIAVSFFQSYSGQNMEIWWSSNTGIVRQKVPDNAFTGAATVTNPPVVTPPVITEPIVTEPVVTVTATGSSDGLKGNTNYYFSTNTGDDSRTPAQAQNPATPWKTISKLNSYMSSLKPGDAILFKRNEIFDGGIVLAQSGSSSLPIIFSAFGTGVKPVINGFSTLTSWTSVGTGVYEANANSGTYMNMVTMNGKVMGMGRYPNITAANRGYLTIESHAGNYQITDNQLTDAVNWKGAEVAIRKNDWVIDRAPITAHSGSTISYTSPTVHQATDGFGYFIQNSPLTLDQQGEWYYNPATKKLRIYTGSTNPGAYTIKAGVVDALVTGNSKNYITFDNISFLGADVEAFGITNSSNVKVQNCDIDFSGVDAIAADNAPYLTIENNTINHSNNSGIRVYQGSSYAIIRNNVIRNSGTIPGMGTSNNQEHDGIFLDATPGGLVELNTVDSSGYCGITFTGDYTTVRNNMVSYFCLTVTDGGGIYTWGGWDKVGRKVIGNVVLHGIGAPEGTNNPVAGGSVGIYTDDRSSHVEISNNSVAHCNRAGIFLHNSHEIDIKWNTLFNNGIQLSMVHDILEPADPIRNNHTQNNILSTSKANLFLIENSSVNNDIASFGSYDYNFYVRPMAESGIINANTPEGTSYYDLSGWTAKYGYDRNSSISPIKIPGYIVNKLIGANKFVNGSFNSNVDGVVFQSYPGNGGASYSTGKLDGGAVQINFDASSGATNDVGIYLDFGAVTAGKSYLIKFSLLSSAAGKTIKTFILQNGGSYGKLSDIRYFDLSTTRSENEFLFTATSTVSNAMIAFELNGKDCPFWFDNFDVREAEVVAINPEDHMRFEYNGTSTPKTVSLGNNYVDASNRAYSGNITIAPFSSLILMKQPTATSVLAGKQETTSQLTAATIDALQEKTATVMSVKVSPNPVREKLQVSVDLPAGTQSATMSIYSLAGVKLKTMPIATNSNIVPVDVTSLNSGVYIININYDGHVVTRKFVKQL